VTTSPSASVDPGAHTISVVVPVYRGERHLPFLMRDIEPLTTQQRTPDGHAFRVAEVVLVNDCGPDASDRVMRELSEAYEWVRPVWLSRNFGQHAATIAGMASTGSEWIVTLDEDGQHDPGDIGVLLDCAVREGTSLVYASPVNVAPHSAFRRVTSRTSKRIVNLLGSGSDASVFHSYRLVLGEIGRSVAAYVGQGVYLDVALSWVARTPSTAPVTLRGEGERQSGYSARTLASHFWRMVLTSGTRALRLVSLLGAVCAFGGVALATWLIIARLAGSNEVAGWTSLMVVTLLCTGVILFSLGVIAEYLGVAVHMAMGRPPYLIVGDPATGPLGRDDSRES
jgi:glycosyltransferase involved in cell wall biosynthesis